MKTFPIYTVYHVYPTSISPTLLEEILKILSKVDTTLVATDNIDDATISEFKDFYKERNVSCIRRARFFIPSEEYEDGPVFVLNFSGNLHDGVVIAYEKGNLIASGLANELDSLFQKNSNIIPSSFISRHFFVSTTLSIILLGFFLGYSLALFTKYFHAHLILFPSSFLLCIIVSVILFFSFIIYKLGKHFESLIIPIVWFNENEKTMFNKMFSPTKENIRTFIAFLLGILVTKLVDVLISLLSSL